MKVIQYFKTQKLTDWIQVSCSLLLVVAAFWALFTWKNQKEYDVEILAISNASNHFQTFLNVYVLSYEGLSDDAREEMSAFVNKNKELVKQYPDILSTLIVLRLLAENKKKYRTDYELMIEHCNLILSTFDERHSPTNLYEFYRYLHVMSRKIDGELEIFEMDLDRVITNKTMSSDQRRKYVNDLVAQAQNISDTRKDISDNIMSLHASLVELRSF